MPNIYTCDIDNQQVCMIDGSGNLTIVADGTPGDDTTPPFGDGESALGPNCCFDGWSIAVDSDENIYINDQLNQLIRKITKSTGIISTIGGSYTESGPIPAPDGTAAFGANLDIGYALTVDKDGNLYFADDASRLARVINMQSAPIVVCGHTVNPGCLQTLYTAADASIYGIAVAVDGTVWITDEDTVGVVRIDPVTGDSSLLGAGFQFAGIAVDKQGNVYFNEDDPEIWVRNVQASEVTLLGQTIPANSEAQIIAAFPRFRNAWELALDDDGNLYLTSPIENTIIKIDTTGAISVVAGTAPTPIAYTSVVIDESAGTMTFTGIFPGGASNAYLDKKFVTSGWTDDHNNGVYNTDSSTSTQIVLHGLFATESDPGGTTLNLMNAGDSATVNGPATSALFSFLTGVAVPRTFPTPPPAPRGSNCDAARNQNAFLLIEKTPQSNQTYQMKAVNYSDAYYDHDGDFDLTGTGSFKTGGDGSTGDTGFGTDFGIFGG